MLTFCPLTLYYRDQVPCPSDSIPLPHQRNHFHTFLYRVFHYNFYISTFRNKIYIKARTPKVIFFDLFSFNTILLGIELVQHFLLNIP